MITRILLHRDGNAYQITAILHSDACYDIVEVIRLPLEGKPCVVSFDSLEELLQDSLTQLITQ